MLGLRFADADYRKLKYYMKEQWVEKQNRYLLNTGYFHVVFTLPEKLNAVLLRNQGIAYAVGFAAGCAVSFAPILIIPPHLPAFRPEH